MLNTQEIIDHNDRFYDSNDYMIWMSRKILEIEGVFVPQYIYRGLSDPLDHDTYIYHTVMDNKQHYEGKKFLDIGTCAGINNILLTRAGFNVQGLDNNIYSLNASLYVMHINKTFYKLNLGDQNDIEKMNYDVLIINQMSYIPDFMKAMKPIIEREQNRGKEVLVYL